MATHETHRKRPVALIVEDDTLVRELAAALLEESELRVVECEDAEQAFASLCKYGEEIVLIFADVRLPGLLDGVDLAQRAKVLWPQTKLPWSARQSGIVSQFPSRTRDNGRGGPRNSVVERCRTTQGVHRSQGNPGVSASGPAAAAAAPASAPAAASCG